MKKNLIVAVCGCFFALTLTGCPDLFPEDPGSSSGTSTGSLAIDISNRVFADDAGTETGYSRRLGADSVAIYINGSTTAAATLLAANINETETAEGYTRVAVTYSGNLSSVRLVASGTNTYEASSTGGYTAVDTAQYEDSINSIGLLSELEGASTFAEVEKIKMYPSDSYSSSSSVGINLVCGPVWMFSPSVYTSDSSSYSTERSLASGQIEIHPDWSENPEGLTVDVYMVSSDYTKLSDLSYSDGWSTSWTYDQITSTGRTIGGTLYTMEKINTTALDAPYLGGATLRSYLVENLDSTAYYYIAIVTHFGNSSCYSAVKEIQIP